MSVGRCETCYSLGETNAGDNIAMIDDSTPIIQWLNEQPKVTTINDLPKEHAPNIDVDPTVYAMILASINPWPIPPSFKKRLQSVEQNGMQVLNITCSMSMTFYHSKTKRFYGSTYIGHEHHWTIQKSSSKIVFENFNELTYFFTRINDPNCFLVIELVMNILSPLSGGISGRVGCGWAILNPYVGELKSTGKICLYEGSPKRLLECKGNHTAIENHLAKHNKRTTSSVSFTIWRSESLSKTLPLCLKENQIVGAHTPIAGLRSTTINYFDDRQSIVENCIGAITHGNILDWTLSPLQLCDTTIFANSRTVKASNISVTLPQRRELERTLQSWMTHSLPKEDRTSSIFGWRKAKVLDDNGTASVIMQPRVSFAVHNGHTILRGQWYEIELHSIGEDEDRLYAKGEIEIDYFEHNSCSLLCKVEYRITNITTTKGLQSPSKSISHQITVVAGMSLYFPSVLDERCAVMLNLVDDARCQVLCNYHLFSRQRCSESDSPQSFLKFELVACDMDDSCLDNSTASTLLHITDDIKDDDRVDSEHDGLNVFRIDDRESLSKPTSPCNEDVSLSDSTSSHRTEEDEHSVIKEQITTEGDVNSGSEIKAKSDTQAVLPIELADPCQLTSVTITFRTLSTESFFKESKSVSFQLKFHAYEEIMTTHAIREVNGVIKFTHPASFSFVYECTEELMLYMMRWYLYVEVFDDSLKHLGTITLPMYIFLRQSKERKILENLSVDIIAPVYDNDTLRLDEPHVGSVAEGSIIISIDCVGSITPGPLFSPTASTGAESKHAIARQYGWERGVNLVFHDITINNEQVSDKSKMLKAIQWARESEKQAIIANHILHQKATTHTFRPWVGAKVIRLYSFTKRLSTNELFDIEISHPVVRVLTKTDQISHGEGSTYESVELAFECNYIEPITVTVSLVSFLTRKVVDAFKIEIRPQLRVDRRFVLPGFINEYIRKTIMAGSTSDGLKASIKVIDTASCNRNTVKERIGVTSEVQIEFLCPETKISRFYILFSYDDFITLHETWEFIVIVQSAPTLKTIGGWKGVFDFSDTVDER